MKYRKKPVVIQAWRVPPVDGPRDSTHDCPGWLAQEVAAGIVEPIKTGGLSIDTREGTMRADVGDWVIQGVKGELYPCKPDIFAATYDLV